MSKILVTGGSGYIGSHTVVELQQAGFEVVIVDNLSNSNIEVLNGIEKITGIRPIFENVDCTDFINMDKMFEKHKPIDGIIHFAASKSIEESVARPVIYYKNSLVSLLNLLQLMPTHNIANIVASSSCTVYGQPDTDNLPVTEKAPIKVALSPYGNTKQIAEEIITDTAYSNRFYQATILRYFNPIGAHSTAAIGGRANGVPQHLLPYIAQTAIGIRKQLQVFGNDYNTPDGTCIRDYINVVDLAKAHVVAVKRMLEKRNKKNVEIFNLGTGRGLSVLELITTFEKVNGVKVPYKIVDRRPENVEQIWADTTFANQELGWKAEETLEDTLRSAWKRELILAEKNKNV